MRHRGTHSFGTVSGFYRTIRRASPIFILALVMATLPAAIATDGSTDEPTSLALRIAVQEDLAGISAAATGEIEEWVDKALEKVEKSLVADHWTADGTVVVDKAKKVFDLDKKAAKELGHVAADPAVAAVLDQLLAIDQSTAQAAIDEAAAAGADVTKAVEERAKAQEELSDGEFDKAVDKWKKAWEKARKADDEASGGNGGGWGDSIVYTFVMVRADTVDSATPEFIVVSGSSDSNEGFLYDDRFDPPDTYLGEDGVMQVHVSCSDAFPGGIGEKSDPAATSQWLVNHARIQKMKDGEVNKDCEVLGAALPWEPGPDDITEPPIGPPGSGSGGDPGPGPGDSTIPEDGRTYTFVFVHRDTIDDPEPVFIEVTGTSDSNEGFLYDDHFDPPDTYLDADGVMQVHVSCSDAFAGGIGEKSDPSVESQWLVNFADIQRYRDGQLDKECHVTGVDLPYTPPDPGDPGDPPANPAIDVEKEYSIDGGITWIDGDEEPGDSYPSYVNVDYRFTIANTGDVELGEVMLSDTNTPLGVCAPVPVSLAVGESFTCVVLQQWIMPMSNASTATVSGVHTGVTVTDSDAVYLWGEGGQEG